MILIKYAKINVLIADDSNLPEGCRLLRATFVVPGRDGLKPQRAT
jgi:hypothetical protein